MTEAVVYIVMGVSMIAAAIVAKPILKALIAKDVDLEHLKDIVVEGVHFAELVYHKLDGPKKKQEAMKYISEELQKLGLQVDERKISTMIEVAVRSFNREFGKHWVEATKQQKEDKGTE